jgi:hypothetical protein
MDLVRHLTRWGDVHELAVRMTEWHLRPSVNLLEGVASLSGHHHLGPSSRQHADQAKAIIAGDIDVDLSARG